MRGLLILSIPLFLATACAYTPHDVALALQQPEISNPSVGEGTFLRLRVLDERDDDTVGNRGAGISAASVSATNVMEEFTRVVQETYAAKGYTLTDDVTTADATLDISLRSLKFDETMGFWTVGANVSVTILADAERGVLDYKNTYRYNDEERQFAVSTGGGIDESINAALNSAIAELAADEALDAFLTAGEAAPEEEPVS
jgi:uncharacterized lipoprotein YajG